MQRAVNPSTDGLRWFESIPAQKQETYINMNLNISFKDKFLLIITPFIFPLTYIVFYILTKFFGKTTGYLLGFILYWIFCFMITIIMLNKKTIKKLIHPQKILNIKSLIITLFSLIPVFLTFFITFVNSLKSTTFSIISIVIIIAIINGLIEELFWRGTFIKVFKKKFFQAYIYPLFFFGIWHITLALMPEIHYQGGVLALVGGSFIMGAIWGWVAYKQESVFITIISHILVNIFTFTGLVIDNFIQ